MWRGTLWRQTLNQHAAVIDFPALTRNRSKPESKVERYKFRNMEEVVAFVASEIAAANWTYTKIAERAHVCSSTVSKIANHETQSPRFATVHSILAVLGLQLVAERI
jgi:DNA-binding phage protein